MKTLTFGILFLLGICIGAYTRTQIVNAELKEIATNPATEFMAPVSTNQLIPQNTGGSCGG